MPECQNIRLVFHVFKLILVPDGLLLNLTHKLKIQIVYFSSFFDLIQIGNATFDSVQMCFDGALSDVCLLGQVGNEVLDANVFGGLLELLLHICDNDTVLAILLHGL